MFKLKFIRKIKTKTQTNRGESYFEDRITSKDKLYMILFGLIFLFAAVGMPVILWSRSQISKGEDIRMSTEVVEKIIATSVPIPTDPVPTEIVSQPSPTFGQEEKLDKNIRILNGSGVRFEASKVAKLLTDNGFKRIDTGNAESFDYEETRLLFKSDFPEDKLQLVEKALDSYQSIREKENIGSESSHDLIIIVGKKKND